MSKIKVAYFFYGTWCIMLLTIELHQPYLRLPPFKSLHRADIPQRVKFYGHSNSKHQRQRGLVNTCHQTDDETDTQARQP